MNIEPLQLSADDVDVIEKHISSSKYLAINAVKGPYDLVLLSEVRRHLPQELFVHPSAPLSIFPLSTIAVDPQLCCTYLGGEEIHQGTSPWPKGQDGKLLPFLAQIDLRSAHGYRETYRAIQIFSFARNEFLYRWVSNLDLLERGPTVNQFRLHGSVPVQVPSYPRSWASYEVSEDLQQRCEEAFHDQQLLDLPLFLEPLGVSIGPAPYVPPDAARDGRLHGLMILACLPTIYPQTDRPYEFVGSPSPLPEEHARRFQFSIGPYLDDDSFGILYVCQSIDSDEIHLLYVQM